MSEAELQSPSRARGRAHARGRTRGKWLRLMHSMHWISSAVCLVGMVLFSVTGITLNHAGEIGTEVRTETRDARMPSAPLEDLASASAAAAASGDSAEMPASVIAWLDAELGIDSARSRPEWSADELYLAFPRPGGDAWLAVDIETGEVVFETTERGWIAWLNDLHKGRDAGIVWRWFIDVFAVATLIFAGTGLVLLYLHSRHRRGTWGITGLGLVLPWLLILFFVP